MKLYLTAVGQALLYKAQGGQTLKLTRFGLGNGELGGQAIQELTALINEKMSSNITKLNVNTNKVVVGMSFTNSELTEGFYFRELGLFAEDPDSGEEVLYMYANAAEASDYIDSNTGKVIEENLDVEIIISDVKNITATIDGSLVYLTLNGDASNTTVNFTESEEKTNVESGDTLSVLFGKIRKWFSSFAKVAFSGKFADLKEVPDTFTPSNHSHSSSEITESDPTVSDWAKASTKPKYTADEVGAMPASTVVTAFWSGTQAEYDALTTKDSTTLYLTDKEA